MEASRTESHSAPDPEELKFIYRRFARYSDSEIAESLLSADFPQRSPDFIRLRRREYELARQIIESNRIDSEHLADIRNAIGKLREVLINHSFLLLSELEGMVLSPNSLPPALNRLTGRRRVFEPLKAHIDSTDLWRLLDQWMADFIQFAGSYRALRRRVSGEIEAWRPGIVSLLKGFMAPVIARLEAYFDGLHDARTAGSPASRPGWSMKGRCLYYHLPRQDSPVLLAKDDPQPYIEKCEGIIDQVLWSPEVHVISHVKSRCAENGSRIADFLEEVLLSGSYRGTRCPQCP